MIKKISQLIQYLLNNKNFKKKKLILISFDNFLIEKIKQKYQIQFPLDTQIITIEQFLEKISGLSLCKKDDILFYFFYFLTKNNNNLIKNFHDFFQWGPKILDDFQDLDLHLIKIESFFSSMISIEKIKKWNLVNLEKKLKNNIKFFWEEIYQNYTILKNELLKKKDILV
ncbi:hypothetical protein [Blattabacterium cuenoti]|uniref:hypothetical protein n=1 Tax=Blattabacterium cuenoti TaxID=1653831 RepID=UPI001EEC79AE|nr:hypothetical protein [Blattabacterium cuenoti]